MICHSYITFEMARLYVLWLSSQSNGSTKFHRNPMTTHCIIILLAEKQIDWHRWKHHLLGWDHKIYPIYFNRLKWCVIEIIFIESTIYITCTKGSHRLKGDNWQQTKFNTWIVNSTNKLFTLKYKSTIFLLFIIRLSTRDLKFYNF